MWDVLGIYGKFHRCMFLESEFARVTSRMFSEHYGNQAQHPNVKNPRTSIINGALRNRFSALKISWITRNKSHDWYSWWKKSCTTWDISMWSPIQKREVLQIKWCLISAIKTIPTNFLLRVSTHMNSRGLPKLGTNFFRAFRMAPCFSPIHQFKWPYFLRTTQVIKKKYPEKNIQNPDTFSPTWKTTQQNTSSF